MKYAQGTYVVDVILTDPTRDDLDWFFEAGLLELDAVLSSAVKERGRIQRIVATIENRKLHVKYAVRSDAAPVAVY